MSGLHTLAWSPFDPWHLLVLGIVALLLFGKRLPEVGRSLGRGIAEFKKGLRDVESELGRDDTEPEPPKRKLQAPESENEEQNTPRRIPHGQAEEPGVTKPPSESQD